MENSIEDHNFSSYPIIYEISEYHIKTAWEKKESEKPKLYLFFEDLSQNKISNLVVGFADEWKEYTTVKIEKLKYNDLSNRLNSEHVWCPKFTSLRTNSDIRDEFHPLILEVHN